MKSILRSQIGSIFHHLVKQPALETQKHLSLFRFVPAYIVSYLYGSLPLVYWLGRRSGVNLKESGSWNVGAASLFVARGGIKRTVIGFLFDASKGYLPIFICRRLGYPAKVAELAGVWGVIGQCWPVFLHFNGGRGLSPFIGASYLINRKAWAVSLVPMIGGFFWRIMPSLKYPLHKSVDQLKVARSRSTPFGCFLGILIFPLLCSLERQQDRKRQLAVVLLPLLLLGRRLTAFLPDDAIHGPAQKSKAVLYRLIYDRNTKY